MKKQVQELLQWYTVKRRILPWRKDPTPYHVWISEIMLQQTRVEAVKGYYERFLEKFPDIASLAAAYEDTLMKLWQGLGYYSRARNLWRAARIIMEDFDGKMPGSAQELKKLPGIGDYTSAAIASIAFGEAVPAVDGNFLRVFARMQAYEQDIRGKEGVQLAKKYYSDLIPEECPGDFNQAVMDLGALVCVPNGEPSCSACPWGGRCRAFAGGRQTDFPVTEKKPARKTEELTVLLVHEENAEGRILLEKRPEKGLLAGLYGFPALEGRAEEKEVLKYLSSLKRLPLRMEKLPDGKNGYFARHIFTHREWHMHGIEIWVQTGDSLPAGFVFADPQQIRKVYSIPSVFRAFLEYLQRAF